jgi:hypothetical protein
VSKRDQPLKRRHGSRPERQRFLIYCEGSVTEELYIKELKRELRAATVAIKIGNSHGEPYRLVTDAVEHQRRAPRQAEDRYEAYDRVWCVFDVEAPRPHPRLREAIELAEQHRVRCAVSNPCFELWLYLHFRDQHSYVTSEQMARLLEGCGCGYTRASKHFDFSAVHNRRAEAFERASRLHERHGDTLDVARRNPWTSIDALVAELYRNATT